LADSITAEQSRPPRKRSTTLGLWQRETNEGGKINRSDTKISGRIDLLDASGSPMPVTLKCGDAKHVQLFGTAYGNGCVRA